MKLFLALAIVALLGVCIFQGKVIKHQRETIQFLQTIPVIPCSDDDDQPKT